MNTFERDVVKEIEALKRQVAELSPTKRRVPLLAKYRTAAGQSIPNASATIVNFGTLVRDTNSSVTTGAAWKFTAPTSGDYGISSAIMYSSTTTWVAGEAADLVVYLNGAAVDTLDYKNNLTSTTTAQFMQLSGATTLWLDAGNTIDLRTTQQSGAALALINNGQFNYVNIWRI